MKILAAQHYVTSNGSTMIKYHAQTKSSLELIRSQVLATNEDKICSKIY